MNRAQQLINQKLGSNVYGVSGNTVKGYLAYGRKKIKTYFYTTKALTKAS